MCIKKNNYHCSGYYCVNNIYFTKLTLIFVVFPVSFLEHSHSTIFQKNIIPLHKLSDINFW